MSDEDLEHLRDAIVSLQQGREWSDCERAAVEASTAILEEERRRADVANIDEILSLPTEPS
jgi:hypothetical protein